MNHGSPADQNMRNLIRRWAGNIRESQFQQIVRARSMSERADLEARSRHQSIVDIIRQAGRYRVNPAAIVNPQSDVYAHDLIITQLRDRHKKKCGDPSLDVSQINDEYQVFVNDGSITNPFVISKELVRMTKRYTQSCRTDEEKARAIFDWIEQNIQYGTSKRTNGYSNTQEVLRNREGVCGEMAFLFITKARAVSLRSAYASVAVDCFGESVHHGCAIVDVGDRDILVDPAYHTYDVKHKEFTVLSDREVIERFSQWRS